MMCAACALANASAICAPIFNTSESGRPPRGISLVERTSLDQLHHHVGDITLGAEVVDGDDVGMLECGDGAGFVQKARLAILVRHHVGAHDLQCHVAAKTRIVGTVDGAHAPFAENRQELVRPDTRSWSKRHRRCDYTAPREGRGQRAGAGGQRPEVRGEGPGTTPRE